MVIEATYDSSGSSEKINKLFENVPSHRQISVSHGTSGEESPRHKKKLMPIGEYLYQKGYLEGVCSDVQLRAFGKTYKLHKFILCRTPYFSSLFSGLWNQCGDDKAEEAHNLDFELDENITSETFEIVLQRLYGHEELVNDTKNLAGLFAIAKFLDLPDLEDQCVDQIIRSINAETIGNIANFSCKYDYGKSSNKISEACKNFLCSDGYEIGVRYLDGVPEQLLADVLVSDSFFVSSEWERCQFIIKLYWQKYHRLAREGQEGEFNFQSSEEEEQEQEEQGDNVQLYEEEGKAEEAQNDEADDSGSVIHYSKAESGNEKIDSSKLAIIKLALNTGVHFCHLSYEQLSELENVKDFQDEPLISKEVLREGLWLQIDLRQKILKCAESDDRLGIAVESPESKEGKHYTIPTDDETTSNNKRRQKSEESSEGNSGDDYIAINRPVSLSSRFPPFRFSVIFKDVNKIPQSLRVYSDTLWYAGSFWSLYIQKTAHKNGIQLGVYLHRGKLDNKPLQSNQFGGQVNSSFHSYLRERSSYPSGSFGNLGRNRRFSSDDDVFSANEDGSNNSDNVEDEEMTTVAMENLSINDFPDPRHVTPVEYINRPIFSFADPGLSTNSGNSLFGSSPPFQTSNTPNFGNLFSPPSQQQQQQQEPSHAHSHLRQPVKTCNGDYRDLRPKVCAYFEIYTPSRRGKTSLTCFRSSPDTFDFSQSWGWKSASLGAFTEENGKSNLKFMVTVGAI